MMRRAGTGRRRGNAKDHPLTGASVTRGDNDLDRISKEANRTTYGLAGSVWTHDLSIAYQMVRKIKAGTVGVNMLGSIDLTLLLVIQAVRLGQ
jgi:hypothetical protein